MIDVLFNSQMPEAERQGIPEWPAQVLEAAGSTPPPGWTRMSREDYATHRAQHEAAQDAWMRTRRVPEAKAAALARLAEYRWLRESEGVRVGGMLVETDREARGSLTSAVVLAQMAMAAGQPFAVAWKTREGFRDLDAGDLIQAGNAAAAHVAWCFAHERVLAEQIEQMTDPDAIAAIDLDAAWATGKVA